MEFFGDIFRHITIVSTTLGNAKEVLANVRGLAESDADEGEASEGNLLHGVLGLLVKPKPKDANGAAIGIAAVSSDRLTPIATVDRRISRARGTLPDWYVSLSSYEGQHVSLEEGANPGQARITLSVLGAKLVLEGGLLGAHGTVEATGALPAQNVALYEPIQPLLREIVDSLQLLIAGDPLAVPTPVPGLATVLAALPGGLTGALTTQLGVLQAAALTALNASIASSAVLRASPM